MNDEMRDAIENARTVATGPGTTSRPIPRHSFETIKRIIVAVAEALPPETTMGDILEDIQ